MIAWSHAGPSVLSAFLASLVEFVEALTIVLAVGTVRGWRSALSGAAAGAALLAVLVALFGPLLGQVPIHVLQLVVGALLVLFGMRWLRKAILRAAGVIALHDEEQAFAKETAKLGGGVRGALSGLDPLAVATTFKAVVLEGLEVVFIVIAVGAVGGMLIPATLGAAAALVLVVGLGLVVHKPLAQVPENTLKFAVGVMLAAYGVFWVGEGFGLAWPGEDLAILVLAGLLLASAIAAVPVARRLAEGEA
jgi:uncharacterized membrane protein